MTTTCRQGCSLPEIFPENGRCCGVPIHRRNMAAWSQVLVCVAAMEQLDREDDLLRTLFSPGECEQVRQLRFPKRRHEWMAGRIAAKAAALSMAGCGDASMALNRLTLLADDHGRPAPDSSWPPGVGRPSISHSHAYAVAMVAGRGCGIDVQRIEEARIGRLADRIVSKREKELLQAGVDSWSGTGLTLIWSVKEAMKKMWYPTRPALFEATRVEEIISMDDGQWRVVCRLSESGQVQVATALQMEQYILAWCTEDGNNA